MLFRSALDGGAARPTRVVGFFAFGGAPLGPTAFVFTRPPFAAAAGVAAGAAPAAASLKKTFGIRFLFDGMVAEITAATSPLLG